MPPNIFAGFRDKSWSVGATGQKTAHRRSGFVVKSRSYKSKMQGNNAPLQSKATVDGVADAEVQADAGSFFNPGLGPARMVHVVGGLRADDFDSNRRYMLTIAIARAYNALVVDDSLDSRISCIHEVMTIGWFFSVRPC